MTSRSSVGGKLGMREMATLYRPHDEATLRAAAVDLRMRGLTDRDIAAALRLTEAGVRQLLEAAV